MQKVVLLVLLITVFAFAFLVFNGKNPPNTTFTTNSVVNNTPVPGENKTDFPLVLPNNFTLSVFSKDIDAPRDLVLDPNGTVLVSAMNEGKIYALLENEKKVVAQNLTTPHGMDFFEGRLYVAEQSQVSIFNYDPITKTAANKRKIVDLPSGGNHVTRSILIHDNKLYISVGSSCNVCIESDNRRGKIMIADLDGSNLEDYANGLRNSVFMAVNPKTNQIWATEMGRDRLGDDTPPEEINILRKGNFGWPFCYGNNIYDSTARELGGANNCNGMIPPEIEMQAHSAPLGLAFFEDSLLVAYHGSWNRTVPTGYKIVKIDPETKKIEDWISGWHDGKEAFGRPVDILVKSESEIYISDDKADVVYKLASH